MIKIITKTPQELEYLGSRMAELMEPGDFIALDGDLGSGKTLMTQGMAKGLGVNEEIVSPTFTIIHEYETGRLPLYHMDVYRLDGNAEGIGIEEYFNKGGIVIIEWADSIKDFLPKERLIIKFKVVDENKRILIITPFGKQYEELCEAVL